MGLPGFQPHPSVRDVVIDPGGAAVSRPNDSACSVFDYRHSLDLRDPLISWLISTPRTAAVYASDASLPRSPARLAPSLPAKLWLDRTSTRKMTLTLPSARRF